MTDEEPITETVAQQREREARERNLEKLRELRASLAKKEGAK